MIKLCSLFCLIVLCALSGGTGVADDEVTLEGSFVWNHPDGEDRTGDLKAIFTPSGEGEWDVAFHFVWEDEPHVYGGHASGSLTDGALEGTAEGGNVNHKLDFRFHGTVEGGTFEGTHGYLESDGSLKEAGTLRLASVP